MTAFAAWGVLAGLVLGSGLWLIVGRLPRLSRPSLSTRVAPYVIDLSSEARDILERRTADPLPLVGALLAPVLSTARRGVDLVGGERAVTALRLKQAGSPLSVDGFRSRQLSWSIAGAAAGILVALAFGRLQPVPVAVQLVIGVIVTVAGFGAPDYLLRRRARARLERLSRELPTVLEFMTLSLAAGEGILDTMRRVATISRGEVAREFGLLLADVATGIPLPDALNRMSGQLRSPPLSRLVEQLTGALERGSPIVEVLRAQAQDARDRQKRDLLELAGKKETAMLVPLVFLILPVTIAIAVFPGIFVLSTSF